MRCFLPYINRTIPLYLLFLLLVTLTGGPKNLYAYELKEERISEKVLDSPSAWRLIENKGQWHSNVLYQTAFPSGYLYLENNRITYLLLEPSAHCHPHNHGSLAACVEAPQKAHAFRVTYSGANPNPRIIKSRPSPDYSNYVYSQGRTASYVRSYQSVTYENIYPNIDLVWYTDKNKQLKYDFICRPGSNPKDIILQYEGLDQILLLEDQLILQTSCGNLIESPPLAWQENADGNKTPVPCHYELLKGNRVAFRFPQKLDGKQTLVIDPALIFSTYSGAYTDNWGFTATYDIDGALYSGGISHAGGYPVSVGALQVNFGGSNNSLNDNNSLWYGSDIAIIKYSPDGTLRLWATYIGGGHNEQPHSMVTNRAKELYILGATRSTDFPVTPNAYQTENAGKIDIVICKISEDGARLLASTYLGGGEDDGMNERSPNNPLYKFYADDARGEIILDDADNCYIASSSQSPDFPVTERALQKRLQGKQDACIFKLNRNLSELQFSTLWGGSQYDAGYALRQDSEKNIIVVGGANSADGFPINFNGWQKTYSGGTADGYVVKLSPNGDQAISASYIGTSQYDQIYLVDLDAAGNIYFTGQTEGDFPIFNARYNVSAGSQFIVKIDKNLRAPIFSTRFGSGRASPDLTLSAFMVDLCENIYISGWGGLRRTENTTFGSTRNLPVTPDAFQSNTDGADFYLAVFERNLQSLKYGTYFGGNRSEEHVDGGTSRFDKKGIVYQSVCAGCGRNNDFPTTPNSWSRANNSNNCNNGAFKLAFDIASTVVAEFDYELSSQNGCAPYRLRLRNKSQGAAAYIWHLGNGQTTGETNPEVTFSSPGVYTIKLVAINPNKCNQRDEVTQEIVVKGRITPAFNIVTNPCNLSVQVENLTTNCESYIWDWGDGVQSFTWQPGVYFYRARGRYLVRLVTNPNTACADTLEKIVELGFPVNSVFEVKALPCSYNLQVNNSSLPAGGTSRFFINNIEQRSAPPAVYRLPQNGKYTLTLIYTIAEGCADTTIQEITLPPIPQADFLADSTCTRNVYFKNTSLWASSYLWDFGDRNQTSVAVNPGHLYPLPGIYRVRLIAEPYSNCPDTIEKNIHVSLPPQARFIYRTQSCPQEIEFINQSRYGNDYIWLINGERITTPNLTYRFPAPGRYFVTLIANPHSGCPDMASQLVEIGKGPSADFQYEPAQCSRTVLLQNLSGEARRFLWDFGDGSQSTDYSPLHSYANAGYYKVTLIAEPGSVCADTIQKWITVRETPKADFTYRIPECNLKVFFENLSQGGVSYHWDFGDGHSSRSVSPIHIYSDTGVYRVRLIVNPDSVCPHSFTLEVHITKGVAAKFKPPLPTCSSQRYFENTSSLAYHFWWDFGDSSFSREKNPTHIYQTPGLYTVSLIVEAQDGCRDTTVHTIKIPILPTADFEFSPPSCNGKVNLRNKSGNSVGYYWEFGDGASSSETNPIHSYAQNGTYTIRLTAHSIDSCPAVYEKPIRLDNLTKASFTAEFPKCEPNLALKNLSLNATEWLWEIGDTITSVEWEPSLIFAPSDTFWVKLIALGPNGCKDTAQQQIFYKPKPKAQFSVYNSRCSDLVELKNESVNASHYLWLEGDQKIGQNENISLRLPLAQSYFITLIANPEGACPDTVRKTVEVDAPPIAKVEVDSIYCRNKVTLKSRSLNAAQIKWYIEGQLYASEQNSVTLFSLAVGRRQYALSVMSRSGCVDSVSGRFVIKPLTLAHFEALVEPCNPMVRFKTDSSINASQYLWQKGNQIFSTAAEPTERLEPGQITTITLIVNPDSACPDTFKRNIRIETGGKAAFRVSRYLCDSILRVQNLSQNAKSYFWDFGDGGFSSDSAPQHRFLAPGLYKIKLITDKGTFCADSAEQIVETPKPLEPNFIITQQTCGPRLDIKNLTTSATRYRWEFSDGTTSETTEPVKSFAAPGVYTFRLIAYDSKGCAFSKSVSYPYDPNGNYFLDIPNVFSPNNDGVNDRFDFAHQNSPCIEQVEIYDRWGVRVFYTQDYTQTWDGTYNSQPVPEGVYIYVITVGKNKRVGNVTVLR